MYYFGTSLNSKGYFLWICDGNNLCRTGIRYDDFWRDEFCPETIADDKKSRKKGDVFYFRRKKYTICYIEGSWNDTRNGTKSVFFTTAKVTFGELSLKIMSIPVCRKIIQQMPFDVRWGLDAEHIEKMNELIKNND